MSTVNYFFKVNSGKNLKMGTWLLEARKDPNDDRYYMFISLFGRYKKLFVYTLGPYHTNNYFYAPIVTSGYDYAITSRSTLTIQENHILQRLINELLRTKVLEPSKSEYSAPVKPEIIDGKFDIVVDWSYLNSVCVKRDYPVPDAVDTVCSIEDSSMFSKIIIKDVYHQYSLTDEAKPKTAFTTDFGKFQFTTLHKGMINAEQYVQEMFDEIFVSIDKSSIKNRLGEILIHSTDYYSHMKILKDVFWALDDAYIKIDIDKSVFLVDEINYLGFRLSRLGISIDIDSLALIRNFAIPRSRDELKSFLNLIDSFIIFIDDFDQIAGPLMKLKASKTNFDWKEPEQVAFDKIKTKLINAEFLNYRQRYVYLDTLSMVNNDENNNQLSIESSGRNKDDANNDDNFEPKIKKQKNTN